jgi:hypothetical protein
MENRSLHDAGGTPGGLSHFLIGFAMACVGGYLLSNQLAVVGSYWSFYGASTFGITLLPMLIGVGILFWSGRNLVGWLLAIAGALFILAGLIANMHIYIRPASLFNTLVMLIFGFGNPLLQVVIVESLKHLVEALSPHFIERHGGKMAECGLRARLVSQELVRPPSRFQVPAR